MERCANVRMSSAPSVVGRGKPLLNRANTSSSFTSVAAASSALLKARKFHQMPRATTTCVASDLLYNRQASQQQRSLPPMYRSESTPSIDRPHTVARSSSISPTSSLSFSTTSVYCPIETALSAIACASRLQQQQAANDSNEDFETILARFIKHVSNGNLDEIQALLLGMPGHNRTLLIHAQDQPTLRTPLHIAAECGHLSVVEYLVERRAEIDARDKTDWYMIHATHAHSRLTPR
jgi:hypothetical protein